MDFPKAAAVIGGKTGTVPALARTPHGFPTRRPTAGMQWIYTY
jgi:hypothetical protein